MERPLQCTPHSHSPSHYRPASNPHSAPVVVGALFAPAPLTNIVMIDASFVLPDMFKGGKGYPLMAMTNSETFGAFPATKGIDRHCIFSLWPRPKPHASQSPPARGACTGLHIMSHDKRNVSGDRLATSFTCLTFKFEADIYCLYKFSLGKHPFFSILHFPHNLILRPRGERRKLAWQRAWHENTMMLPVTTCRRCPRGD